MYEPSSPSLGCPIHQEIYRPSRLSSLNQIEFLRHETVAEFVNLQRCIPVINPRSRYLYTITQSPGLLETLRTMQTSSLARIVLLLTALVAADKLTWPYTSSLRETKSLEFRNGHYTLGYKPDHQLLCTGGSARGIYRVPVITCENIAGQDDYSMDNVNWRCTADLPEEFALGSTDVICQYISEDDNDTIVSDSCRLRYTLMLTELGEQRILKQQPHNNIKPAAKDKTWTDIIFWTFFTSIAGYIVYSIFRDTMNPSSRNTRPQRRHGLNNGGFDDSDDHDLGGDNPEHDLPSACQPSDSQNNTRSANWLPLALGGGAASAAIMNRYSQSQTRSPSTVIRSDTSSSSFSSEPSTPSHSFDTSRPSTGFGGTGRA